MTDGPHGKDTKHATTDSTKNANQQCRIVETIRTMTKPITKRMRGLIGMSPKGTTRTDHNDPSDRSERGTDRGKFHKGRFIGGGADAIDGERVARGSGASNEDETTAGKKKISCSIEACSGSQIDGGTRAISPTNDPSNSSKMQMSCSSHHKMRDEIRRSGQAGSPRNRHKKTAVR